MGNPVMTETLRPRRSALYLPASNPKALAKARTLDADVVILDLEDAVAPKPRQRRAPPAVAAVAEGGFGRRELVVRANALSTAWGADDLRRDRRRRSRSSAGSQDRRPPGHRRL